MLQDEHGYKAEAWQTGRPDAVEDYPADDEQPADRLAILDGRDALAFVVIRPAGDDPERITVEASARGMSKAVAAYALRQTADQFDRAARAEGDEPITAEEAAEEQQQRARQAPALDRAQPPAPQLTGEQITEYAATIRAHAFESAATIAEQVAAEMREADGTWPEEWSSRDVRDAVESAAERIRAAAEQPADVVPAHVLAAFEQDATARQAHAAAVEEPVDTFADTEETPEAAARRFARRLAAVERLCAGRPGYHTITVKALLTAMSNPDEDVTLVPYRGEHGYPEGESPAEQPTAPHPLTSNERRFLTFALDRAADTMRNEDGFTDADEDALSRLRDLAEDVTLVPYHGEHGYPEGESPTEQRPAAEEPAADWVADVRAAIAFNLPEREPALETLRDVLLDTAPRTPAQALAAARLILAAHTRDQAAAVRKHIADYSAEHGVNRSTRGLITGMGGIRRLLDQRADALDAEAQQP
ncbi:hypothetical protein ACWDN6_14620 [Streptomyces albogriseolus]